LPGTPDGHGIELIGSDPGRETWAGARRASRRCGATTAATSPSERGRSSTSAWSGRPRAVAALGRKRA